MNDAALDGWQVRPLPTNYQPVCCLCDRVITSAPALFRGNLWRHGETDPARLFGACAWSNRHAPDTEEQDEQQ